MSQLVINARFLSQPITGVQRFAIEVSRELAKSDIETSFLCPKKVLHQDLADELKAERCGILSGTAWEQIDLPRILKKRKSPLLLNLANTGPLSYGNQAVVLHDLAFLKHPEWFSKKFVLWYRFLIPFLVKKASTLFTVSEFSKREIESFWPELKQRTSVIGNGLPILNTEVKPTLKAPEKPYAMCIAGNNQRKNASAAINAMKFINDPDFRLLVLGRKSDNFQNGEKSEGGSTKDSRIEFLEEVGDSELAELYKNAEALVYPSLYEGFGLPPLEAISFGCPVVLSEIPVFKEIYEDAAVFVSEANPEGIARAIERIRNDTGLREKLLTNGKNLIEKHTFKKVSERIIQRLFDK